MSITLTKQGAAHRLILCAATMIKKEADPLAIHVIASSALNILREILEFRGSGYAVTAIQTGFYHAALAKSEGRALDFPLPKTLDPFLGDIVTAIKSGVVKNASDVRCEIPSGYERQLLDYVLRPFNFLKHAQRDPSMTLDEDDVKPVEALFHAITAYSMLFPNERLPEEIGDFLVNNDLLLA